MTSRYSNYRYHQLSHSYASKASLAWKNIHCISLGKASVGLFKPATHSHWLAQIPAVPPADKAAAYSCCIKTTVSII